MSNSSDPDLTDVRRVLAGDLASFENIVRRWQGPLGNLAYRFCRDAGIAEELAQEAFLRAYRSLRRFRYDAAFSTWLFAIATNVYRSHLRRFRPLELPIEGRSDAQTSHDPVGAIEREENAEAVRRAVSKLPARYREALVLFYFHEMDVATASRTLGIAEGTLKARLHRGRKLLRRRLAKILVPTKNREVERI